MNHVWECFYSKQKLVKQARENSVQICVCVYMHVGCTQGLALPLCPSIIFIIHVLLYVKASLAVNHRFYVIGLCDLRGLG